MYCHSHRSWKRCMCRTQRNNYMEKKDSSLLGVKLLFWYFIFLYEISLKAASWLLGSVLFCWNEEAYVVFSSLRSLGLKAFAKTSVAPELGKFFVLQSFSLLLSTLQRNEGRGTDRTVLFISLCVSLKCWAVLHML